MTGFAELRDQINKTTDLQEKELLQQQFEATHRAADEESKLHGFPQSAYTFPIPIFRLSSCRYPQTITKSHQLNALKLS